MLVALLAKRQDQHWAGMQAMDLQLKDEIAQLHAKHNAALEAQEPMFEKRERVIREENYSMRDSSMRAS